MRNIHTEHREVRTLSDRFALFMVRGLRWGMDFVTGYKKGQKDGKGAEKFIMSERQWLNRILFLESIAGVPGMVAGMLRHLRSLRTMRRDNGW